MKAHVSKSGAAVVWAGALPSSWDGWFLDITETDPPTISAGEGIGRGPLEVEWADGVPVAVRTTWTVGQVPLVPITKLTLKRRVTPQEWATITGAIAQNADTLENWNLATEIDPAHPDTAAMISQLTSAGLLTTPLHVIFAP